MDQLVEFADELAVAAAVSFPGGILASVTSGGWRRPGSRVRDALLDGVLVQVALLVCCLVFVPQPELWGQARFSPGNDLGVALRAAPGDVLPWFQLIGNVLLLLPLGVLLPLRFAAFDSIVKVAVAGLLFSCAIELTQWMFIAGRVASTDDIVLNTLGAALGSAFTRGRSPSRPRHSGIHGGYPVRELIAEIERERRSQQPAPRS